MSVLFCRIVAGSLFKNKILSRCLLRTNYTSSDGVIRVPSVLTAKLSPARLATFGSLFHVTIHICLLRLLNPSATNSCEFHFLCSWYHRISVRYGVDIDWALHLHKQCSWWRNSGGFWANLEGKESVFQMRWTLRRSPACRLFPGVLLRTCDFCFYFCRRISLDIRNINRGNNELKFSIKRTSFFSV